MTHKAEALQRLALVMSTTVLMLASIGWSLAQTTDQTSTSDETSTKDKSDIEKRIDASAAVLNEVMEQKDKAIPEKIMGDAECVAVVPSMIKIAQDKDDTRSLYGMMVPFASILCGKVNPPNGSEAWFGAVRKYPHAAREQGSLTTPATSDTR